MKSTSADGQNESTEPPWPSVLRIAGDEFQQSFALAQLAVKLCELKKAELKDKPLERENAVPEKFLEEAWKLIQRAREHVLRPQTTAEYLAATGGTAEAREKVIAHKLWPRFSRLQRAYERYAKVAGGDRCKFERGVKLITKEKRLDRAMPWFRKFIRSRGKTEEYADAEIASLRPIGFHLLQLDTLRRDFKEWKRLEKSRLAQASRTRRKKDSPAQKN